MQQSGVNTTHKNALLAPPGADIALHSAVLLSLAGPVSLQESVFDICPCASPYTLLSVRCATHQKDTMSQNTRCANTMSHMLCSYRPMQVVVQT